MKIAHFLCGAAALLVFTAGCMHSGYEGESYPATSEVEVYSRNQAIPDGYSVMGRGWVSGELSGTTRPELEAKLQRMAKSHGADAMVIVASVIRPDGMKINDSAKNMTEATDASSQAQLKPTIDRDRKMFSGDNSGTRYERLIWADFLHRELPAK